MLAFLEFFDVHGGVQCAEIAVAPAGHAIAEKWLPEWLVEVQVLRSGLLSAEIVQKYPHRATQWKI